MRDIDNEYERYTDRLHDDLCSEPVDIRCSNCGEMFNPDNTVWWGCARLCSRRCLNEWIEEDV